MGGNCYTWRTDRILLGRLLHSENRGNSLSQGKEKDFNQQKNSTLIETQQSVPLFDPGTSLEIPMREHVEFNRHDNVGLAVLGIRQNQASVMPFYNNNYDSSIFTPSPFLRLNRYELPPASNFLLSRRIPIK